MKKFALVLYYTILLGSAVIVILMGMLHIIFLENFTLCYRPEEFTESDLIEIAFKLELLIFAIFCVVLLYKHKIGIITVMRNTLLANCLRLLHICAITMAIIFREDILSRIIFSFITIFLTFYSGFNKNVEEILMVTDKDKPEIED